MDDGLEAIRQRRLAQLMAQQGGGGGQVSCLIHRRRCARGAALRPHLRTGDNAQGMTEEDQQQQEEQRRCAD